MKLGVLPELFLLGWLLEAAVASAAPLSRRTTRVYGDTCISLHPGEAPILLTYPARLEPSLLTEMSAEYVFLCNLVISLQSAWFVIIMLKERMLEGAVQEPSLRPLRMKLRSCLSLVIYRGVLDFSLKS